MLLKVHPHSYVSQIYLIFHLLVCMAKEESMSWAYDEESGIGTNLNFWLKDVVDTLSSCASIC